MSKNQYNIFLFIILIYIFIEDHIELTCLKQRYSGTEYQHKHGHYSRQSHYQIIYRYKYYYTSRQYDYCSDKVLYRHEKRQFKSMLYRIDKLCLYRKYIQEYKQPQKYQKAGNRKYYHSDYGVLYR